MRVRFLNPDSPRPHSGLAIPVHLRLHQILSPASTPIRLELDLALALEHGEAALLLPTPHLLELGLRPLLGAQLILPEDAVEALSLWVEAPAAELEIAEQEVLAQLLVLSLPAQRFYDDANLDDLLDPQAGDPFLRFPS